MIFKFECSKNADNVFIICIKHESSSLYFFEIEDTYLTSHPVFIQEKVKKKLELLHSGVKTLVFSLSDEEKSYYYLDDKFIFKDKELKTIEEFQKTIQAKYGKKNISTISKLVFKKTTNPRLFLIDFEKCFENKTDESKCLNLLNFVDLKNKMLFQEFYYKVKWQDAKKEFLNLYCEPYEELKNKTLNKNFSEFSSLKNYFVYMFDNLKTFTKFKKENYLEFILTKLPHKLSCLFLMKEVYLQNDESILNLCQVIDNEKNNKVLNLDDSSNESFLSSRSKIQKKFTSIPEEDESSCTSNSFFNFDESSNDATFSSFNKNLKRTSDSSDDSQIKRRRGRPKKVSQ